MIRFVLSLVVLWCVVQTDLTAETITRGPYLQQATPSSIVVRWRTDVAVTGRVRYGTTLGSPTLTATEAATTTEHSVNLTGLTAGMTYFYHVGNTSTVLVSGATYSFTATPTSIAAPVRVWVLGDCGTRTAGQTAVRDAFYTWNGSTRVDLALLLGDNAYNNGTDTEYQGAIFDLYPESLRQGVFWSTIGNHDTAQATNPALTIPYFKIFTNPTAGESGGIASGTEKYYAFDHGPIHFICLDSMTSSRSATGAMATWLKSDLAATTKPWLIAFWHHPPYTKGSHDSDSEVELQEMRQVFVPIMEDYGVDLVLSGHSHSYERSYLLNGHYGTSTTLTTGMKKNAGNGQIGSGGAYTKQDAAHQGAVYAVPGSAGKISGGSLDHPAMVVSLNELASLAFDVSGDRLDATMIRSDGVIRDSFTIIHQIGVNTPPTVSAGADKSVTLPASVSLAGTATDDGVPSGSILTTTWSQLSGPGTVTFANASAKVTTATFSVDGTYELRLTASDGALSSTADMSVFVTALGGGLAAPLQPSAPAKTGDGTATPTVSGVTTAGATVHVLVDGTEVGTTTAGSDGRWSYTITSSSNGSHAITVMSENAGGTSPPSTATTITVADTGGGAAPSTGGGGGGSCGLGGISTSLLMALLAFVKIAQRLSSKT